ncbi:MAG TPA: flavodoxin domain-containing protein [Chitinophagaceae bacterium]|nr:flavodoxin domain-containing protein [Chitinophagaceae bacterium]
MKSLIIFKGKYGATAQYARWLGEELNFPVHKSDDNIDLKSTAAELIVIGTSIYIGKLQITPWLKNNLASLRNARIFLFLVSGTPANESEKLDTAIRNGVPEELQKNMTVFYLPGRLRISNLSWKDRFMLKMGARLTKDPQVKKAMLTDYDHVKKENLAPLLQNIRAYYLENAKTVALS